MTPTLVVANEGIWIGWLGIQDSLETLPLSLPTLFQSFPWAIITCSDGGIGEWLAAKFAEINARERWNFSHYILTDGSVAVKGSDYFKIATSLKFMGGYEEVWFYDELPSSGPPKGVITMLTFPNILTDAEVQHQVASWAHLSHCLLAIGDGAGIIFATPNQEIFSALVSSVSADGIVVD